MKHERPKWYTIEHLADFWKTPKDMIEYYIQTGRLKLCTRFVHEDTVKDQWTCSTLETQTYKEDCIYLSHLGYKNTGDYIQLKEAIRFEKQGPEISIDSLEESENGKTASLSDAELCEKLKADNLGEEEILIKLMDAFPNIYDSRIGKLLCRKPEDKHVNSVTYTKRGFRLREKYNIKKKKN